MRRGILILAALALAACSVDVEGAQCRVPGAATDCPSGQACGNDHRCSERALACATAGTRCELGAAHCAGANETERVERCTDADPACGKWVTEDCAAAGLECGTRVSAACECPARATASEFAADPVAGSPGGAAPFPTGATSPPACRFKRLGDALDAAADAVVAGGAASVRAHGAAGATVVFGDLATGEEFPLEVAAGVTLHGAEAPAGATVVRAEGVTATALVSLQGVIEDVRIESVPVALSGGGLAGATGAGIATECPAGGGLPPKIEDVVVDGGRSLTKGIEVAGGACGADLSRVEVSRVAGVALEVAAGTGVAVNARGSTFRDSAAGIKVTGGKLTVEPCEGKPSEVSGNAGDGVVITGGPASSLDVAILGTTIGGNGGTGVVLEDVNTASKLALRGSVIYSNGSTSGRSYGGASPRVVGGLLVRQTSLSFPLSLSGTRFSSNAGDQMGFESNGSWSISPGACASANLFACVGEGAYAVGVKGGGSVDASYTVWPAIPWTGYASAGVTAPSAAFCNDEPGAPAPPATCPAP